MPISSLTAHRYLLGLPASNHDACNAHLNRHRDLHPYGVCQRLQVDRARVGHEAFRRLERHVSLSPLCLRGGPKYLSRQISHIPRAAVAQLPRGLPGHADPCVRTDRHANHPGPYRRPPAMTHELAEGLPRRLVTLRHSTRTPTHVGYVATHTAPYLTRSFPVLHAVLHRTASALVSVLSTGGLWYHFA